MSEWHGMQSTESAPGALPRPSPAQAYSQQEDVDRAFAEYDRALLTLHPRPQAASRNPLLCVCCGGYRYSYDSRGGEPGARVCTDCGVVQPGPIIYETMYGRRVPSRTSNYKRIHHWHERISQLLLMESPIPAEHMLAIGERLLDGSHAVINKDVIRGVLRPLGLQVYIEKWLQVIERTTGVIPPCPGPRVLQQLDQLFLDLQRPFNANKPEKRRNFPNYNYVFCRLFQKMNCTKFCMFFPLIRSKVKLRALDEMWQPMVESIGWQCPPLQHVAPFSVRLEQPVALLHRLRALCASQAPAVPRKEPWRMEYHMWCRQPRVWHPSKQGARRSDPPEQRPQTLALRLKRKRMQAAEDTPP